ncbi:MAG: hypothetical protein J6I73_02450 [Treponema sp.]|nr:hypothetical protein [Treponema sp.]
MKSSIKNMMKAAVAFVVCVSVCMIVSCKSTAKTDRLVAEYRYGMSAGDTSGYTFYRFYSNNTFTRGAYGKTGGKSGEILMEHGTYTGSAEVNGTITLTVTSTLNALNGEWLSSNSSDIENGTISNNTFVFNGITYAKYNN